MFVGKIRKGSENRPLARSGSPTSTHPDVPKKKIVVRGAARWRGRVIACYRAQPQRTQEFVVPVADGGRRNNPQHVMLASNLGMLIRYGVGHDVAWRSSRKHWEVAS